MKHRSLTPSGLSLSSIRGRVNGINTECFLAAIEGFAFFICGIKWGIKEIFALQAFTSRSVFSFCFSPSLPPSLSPHVSLSCPLRLLRNAYLSLTYILFSSFTSLFFAHSVLLIRSRFSKHPCSSSLQLASVQCPERQRSCSSKLYMWRARSKSWC